MDPGEAGLGAAFQPGPRFERMVDAGKSATAAALATARWSWPGTGGPEAVRK